MEGVQVSDEEYFFMSSSTYPHPYHMPSYIAVLTFALRKVVERATRRRHLLRLRHDTGTANRQRERRGPWSGGTAGGYLQITKVSSHCLQLHFGIP